MSTLNNRLQLALLKRKRSGNALQKGFTLVELMIVIVIVGILSAVALPNFLNQTGKARATEAQTKIAAALKQAGADFHTNRTYAGMTAANLGLTDTTNFTFQCTPNEDPNEDPPTSEIVCVGTGQSAAQGVRVTGTLTSSDGEVAWNIVTP